MGAVSQYARVRGCLSGSSQEGVWPGGVYPGGVYPEGVCKGVCATGVSAQGGCLSGGQQTPRTRDRHRL